MLATNPLPLVTPDDYVAERRQVFPSAESFRWFERQHRDELVRCGALLKPHGRKLIDPAACDAAIIAIGKRLAGRG